MAGGSRGAYRSMETYVRKGLADAAKSGRIGRPRRIGPWSKRPAEEIHELLQTERGRAALEEIPKDQIAAVRGSLASRNRLWAEQFDEVVGGKPAKISPKAPEEPSPKTTKTEYDQDVRETRPIDKAEASVAAKLKQQGAKNEVEDVRSTSKAVEGVKSARRQAQKPLPAQTNRRDRPNRGAQEADAEEVGTAFNRGKATGAPAGSEVIAGGGDGTKALPVTKKLDDIEGLGKREVVSLEDEMDQPAPPKAEYREMAVGEVKEKAHRPESRPKDERIREVGNTQPAGYLNRATKVLLKDIAAGGSPIDWTYVNDKGAKFEIKKGSRLTIPQAKQLLLDRRSMFEDFVGGGVVRADGSPRRASNGPIEPNPRYEAGDAVSPKERQARRSVAAAGFNPIAATDDVKRASPEAIDEARDSLGSPPTQVGQAGFQSPAKRGGAAVKDVLDAYPKHGRSFLDAIRSAASDEEAYEIAMRLAENTNARNMPGTPISQTAMRDAAHGKAEALMTALNRNVPTSFSEYVTAADDTARRADISSGHTPLTRTKAPVETGPEGTTKDFLRKRALQRGMRPDTPGRPKAGAPGPDDGFTMKASDGTAVPSGPRPRVDADEALAPTVGAPISGGLEALPKIPEPKAAKAARPKKGAVAPPVEEVLDEVPDDVAEQAIEQLKPGRQRRGAAAKRDESLTTFEADGEDGFPTPARTKGKKPTVDPTFTPDGTAVEGTDVTPAATKPKRGKKAAAEPPVGEPIDVTSTNTLRTRTYEPGGDIDPPAVQAADDTDPFGMDNYDDGNPTPRINGADGSDVAEAGDPNPMPWTLPPQPNGAAAPRASTYDPNAWVTPPQPNGVTPPRVSTYNPAAAPAAPGWTPAPAPRGGNWTNPSTFDAAAHRQAAQDAADAAAFQARWQGAAPNPGATPGTPQGMPNNPWPQMGGATPNPGAAPGAGAVPNAGPGSRTWAGWGRDTVRNHPYIATAAGIGAAGMLGRALMQTPELVYPGDAGSGQPAPDSYPPIPTGEVGGEAVDNAKLEAALRVISQARAEEDRRQQGSGLSSIGMPGSPTHNWW